MPPLGVSRSYPQVGAGTEGACTVQSSNPTYELDPLGQTRADRRDRGWCLHYLASRVTLEDRGRCVHHLAYIVVRGGCLHCATRPLNVEDKDGSWSVLALSRYHQRKRSAARLGRGIVEGACTVPRVPLGRIEVGACTISCLTWDRGGCLHCATRPTARHNVR